MGIASGSEVKPNQKCLNLKLFNGQWGETLVVAKRLRENLRENSPKGFFLHKHFTDHFMVSIMGYAH